MIRATFRSIEIRCPERGGSQRTSMDDAQVRFGGGAWLDMEAVAALLQPWVMTELGRAIEDAAGQTQEAR